MQPSLSEGHHRLIENWQRRLWYWRLTIVSGSLTYALTVKQLFFPGIPILTSLISPVAGETAIVLPLLLLLLWSYRQFTGIRFTIEQRTVVRTEFARKKLADYLEYGSWSSKRSSLKSLGAPADTLDMWTAGNLKYWREGIGKQITRFQEGFRYRVIPAIKRGEKERGKRLLSWLGPFQSNLLIENTEPNSFQAYNHFVEEFGDPVMGSSMWENLTSAETIRDAKVLIAGFAVAFAYYEMARILLGADANSAFVGFNAFFAPFVIYVAGSRLRTQQRNKTEREPEPEEHG